jgi:hypothetical protein
MFPLASVLPCIFLELEGQEKRFMKTWYEATKGKRLASNSLHVNHGHQGWLKEQGVYSLTIIQPGRSFPDKNSLLTTTDNL